MLKWIFTTAVLFIFASSAFAEGLSGWANFIYSTIEEFEDGKKISEGDSFNRNFLLGLNRTVTPFISYQLYLRGNLIDTSSTRFPDAEKKIYSRSMEPSLDIYLRNPIYDFNIGYRHTERWSTKSLTSEGRTTNENLNARLNITPYDLPTFSLGYDRRREYDHKALRQLDSTSTRYSADSKFDYSFKDLRLGYSVNFSRDERETPLSILTKSTFDNLNASYNISYSRQFLDNKLILSAFYNGNYIKDTTTFLAAQAGSVSFKRTNLRGIYSHDETPSVTGITETMTYRTDLTDGIFTAISNIDLYAQDFHNIGIDARLSPSQSIDTIRLYVDRNISLESNLNDSANWEVYFTNADPTIGIIAGWVLRAVSSVSISEDSNGWFYEIKFPQAAAGFFKIVNRTESSITDVKATEIEAYGTDVIPTTGQIKRSTDSLRQGLNLSADVRLIRDINLNFSYFLGRTEKNPDSILSSTSGIFGDIFKKSSGTKDEEQEVDVTRIYSANAIWLTHRLLTTNLRISRTEIFDYAGKTDYSSNSYSVQLNYMPLPDIDAGLLILRTDSFDFGVKQSTSNYAILNFNARLYKEFIRLLQEFGYTQTKSHKTSAETDSQNIKGYLDFVFTRNLFANVGYDMTWTSADDVRTKTWNTNANITYRPGRFINITGEFRISYDANKNITTTEGLRVDWLPLPVIRLSTDYKHSHSESGPSTTHTLNNRLTWYFQKFMNVQLTYDYSKDIKETVNTRHFASVNLNINFW